MAHGGGNQLDNGFELLTALFVPVPGRGGALLRKVPLGHELLLGLPVLVKVVGGMLSPLANPGSCQFPPLRSCTRSWTTPMWP